jgi:hypothetical protein
MHNTLTAAAIHATQASAGNGWIPDGKHAVIIAVLGGVAGLVILAANKKGSGKGWLATLALVAVLGGGAMAYNKSHQDANSVATVAPGPTNSIAHASVLGH